MDLVSVLEGLRDGSATLHAVHVAALWSAAARIASNPSNRFGALPARLRGFLAGEAPRCPGTSLTDAEWLLLGSGVVRLGPWRGAEDGWRAGGIGSS